MHCTLPHFLKLCNLFLHEIDLSGWIRWNEIIHAHVSRWQLSPPVQNTVSSKSPTAVKSPDCSTHQVRLNMASLPTTDSTQYTIHRPETGTLVLSKITVHVSLKGNHSIQAMQAHPQHNILATEKIIKSPNANLTSVSLNLFSYRAMTRATMVLMLIHRPTKCLNCCLHPALTQHSNYTWKYRNRPLGMNCGLAGLILSRLTWIIFICISQFGFEALEQGMVCQFGLD